MPKLILVTGAAGKTGRALINGLIARRLQVRAWVRRADQQSAVKSSSDIETVEGDLLDPADWARALAGVDCVYHIPPNMHPSETEMGRIGLQAAAAADRPRFVFHSVLHPQSIALPHHQRKLLVEADLIDSGLPFTIVQPGAYMQNLRPALVSAADSGEYRPPYPAATRLNLVDLDDVAEAAAKVIESDRYTGATLELGGPGNPTQNEVAEAMAAASGRGVVVAPQSPAEWAAAARGGGMSPERVDDFVAMFEYYAERDFVGNSAVLSMLLGRSPHDLVEVLRRMLDAGTAAAEEQPAVAEGSES